MQEIELNPPEETLATATGSESENTEDSENICFPCTFCDSDLRSKKDKEEHMKYAHLGDSEDSYNDTDATDEEIENSNVRGIFLGHFLKWDARKQVDIVKKYGFNTLPDSETTEGTYTNYENLDTKYVAMHDYFKFLKYGYGRATDHASIDIRNNRLTREEGLELVKQYEGKIPTKYLKDFLDDFELTHEEFLVICEKFTNKKLFKTDQNGNLIRDEEDNIQKITYDK